MAAGGRDLVSPAVRAAARASAAPDGRRGTGWACGGRRL